jgi:tRNA nucleotidyltransferase (CCA-adding enzyme)
MAGHPRKPPARDHGPVPVTDPRELADRLRALPGAAEALAAIDAGAEEVYLVGGAVRDLALGGAPVDLDLVVVGDARPLADRLAAGTPERRVRAYGRFGTATVRGARGGRYDLASARAETYPRPGALPRVRPAGIHEDLARRDFTVGALALGLSGPDAGHLLAVPHALEDLQARRLRVLHDRSFSDDPTRLLRLARYAGRLGFAPERDTDRLARRALAGGAIETVSGARIGAELWLLAEETEAAAGFAMLRTLGVDAAIAPGFGLGDPGVLRRARAAVPWRGSPPHPARVALAAALLNVAEAERRPLLDRLGIDSRSRREVLRAAAGAPELARRVPSDGPPSRLLAALPVDEPATVALAAGLSSPQVAAALGRWLSEYAQVRLEIDGDDLVAGGIRPGPAIARGLRAALGARLDGIATSREDQLSVALRAARGGG